MRKNGGKLGKKADSESPYIHYFPLSILYLFGIETLICHTQIEVKRLYFQNTVLNS